MLFKLVYCVCIGFAGYSAGPEWIDSDGLHVYVETPKQVYGYVINRKEINLTTIYIRTNVPNVKRVPQTIYFEQANKGYYR